LSASASAGPGADASDAGAVFAVAMSVAVQINTQTSEGGSVTPEARLGPSSADGEKAVCQEFLAIAGRNRDGMFFPLRQSFPSRWQKNVRLPGNFLTCRLAHGLRLVLCVNAFH
jgi:hypothetical protein